ncbi:hypothetical protein ACFLWA_03745 [Chloroflexota bacterium]
MTKPQRYPETYERWKLTWAHAEKEGLTDDLTWHIAVSAWDRVALLIDNAVRVDEDGCLQCPDCQQEVKAVVKCEITDIPVAWDRKQESFDYSTLDGEIIDNDITEWFCRNCGWKAQDPPMIDLQTLKEL